MLKKNFSDKISNRKSKKTRILNMFILIYIILNTEKNLNLNFLLKFKFKYLFHLNGIRHSVANIF